MELGDRRKKILAAVVNDYVKTAEPVGSQTLVRRYDFGVRPATIRHELAAMSELGYLRQPHTSAGRVPSDLGYRYYVDELMPSPSLEPLDAGLANRAVSREAEIEDILQESCRMLSTLTKHTSMATPPRSGTICIKHVAVSPISKHKALFVTILSTGKVEHRVLELEKPLIPADAVAFGNFLNARFEDFEVGGLTAAAGAELPPEMRKLSWLYGRAVFILRQALASSSDDEVYMEGTANLLRQPEFVQHDNMASVLNVLEHRRALYQILSSSLLGKGVTVIIGSENKFDEMRECSFVSASYSIGDRTCGSIGVVGPTRMDYRRAMAAVRFMASNLSGILTSLSGW